MILRLYLNYKTYKPGLQVIFYAARHYLSNSFQLADALITAAAIVNGTQLLTGNHKHYKAVKELELKAFKPQ